MHLYWNDTKSQIALWKCIRDYITTVSLGNKHNPSISVYTLLTAASSKIEKIQTWKQVLQHFKILQFKLLFLLLPIINIIIIIIRYLSHLDIKAEFFCIS